MIEKNLAFNKSLERIREELLDCMYGEIKSNKNSLYEIERFLAGPSVLKDGLHRKSYEKNLLEYLIILQDIDDKEIAMDRYISFKKILAKLNIKITPKQVEEVLYQLDVNGYPYNILISDFPVKVKMSEQEIIKETKKMLQEDNLTSRSIKKLRNIYKGVSKKNQILRNERLVDLFLENVFEDNFRIKNHDLDIIKILCQHGDFISSAFFQKRIKVILESTNSYSMEKMLVVKILPFIKGVELKEEDFLNLLFGFAKQGGFNNIPVLFYEEVFSLKSNIESKFNLKNLNEVVFDSFLKKSEKFNISDTIKIITLDAFCPNKIVREDRNLLLNFIQSVFKDFNDTISYEKGTLFTSFCILAITLNKKLQIEFKDLLKEDVIDEINRWLDKGPLVNMEKWEKIRYKVELENINYDSPLGEEFNL